MKTLKKLIQICFSIAVLSFVALCSVGMIVGSTDKTASPPPTPAPAPQPAADSSPAPATVASHPKKPAYAVSAGDIKAGPGPQGDALREAQSKLTIACDIKTGDEKDQCEFEAHQFVEEYQNALAGDYLAASNVSYDFRHAQDAFIFPNNIQACAWAMVAVNSGSKYVTDDDAKRVGYACSDLDEIGLHAAHAREIAIERIIRSHKVHLVPVPEINFDPKKDPDEGD